MYGPLELAGLVISYLLLLFGAGYWIQKRTNKSLGFINNSWIYSLSLAVYCTSWTFYGSVGAASQSGMLFLAAYLGPMLSMTIWWNVVRKMVLLKERYHLTSAIDLIAARFDKSAALGALGSLFIVIGIIPYIALQLKSIQNSLNILLYNSASIINSSNSPSLFSPMGLLTVGTLSAITIFFGIRKLDSTERHPGMMFILAIESGVKLIAFVAVGIFVTYYLNNGYGELLDNLPQLVSADKYNFMGESKNTLIDFTTWITYLILGSSAILFLPRQFHVAVIENSNINNIKKARWQFPIYLFIINIFVLPIAIAGLKRVRPLNDGPSLGRISVV